MHTFLLLIIFLIIMPLKATLNLQSEDRVRLLNIFKRGNNWRERERSQTLILLDDGLTMREVAANVGIHIRTVGSTRIDWLKRKFDSLRDALRCGAPRRILPDELKKLQEAATKEPLTATTLLAKHIEGGGEPVHVNTVKDAMKRSDFVWKRTRSSLKKKRDEDKFKAKQIEIGQLREQAKRGERVLAYCDEAGFSCIHPNRSAWTPVGKQHLIPAIRGKRLNVLAAMLSTGELFSVNYKEPTTAVIFMDFVNKLTEHVGEKLTIIIDNASIHKAKAMEPMVESLKKSGVDFFYLPEYSPELNRIETLWHMMKYVWMEVKCRDHKTLKADIEEILNNFGTKYKLAF